MMPSSWQQHMINPLLEERINDTNDEQPKHIEIPHHLQNGVLGQIKTNRPDNRLLPNHNLADVDANRGNIEQEANPEDSKQLIPHRILGMHQSLQPNTIDDRTKPNKLMNNLLDPKANLSGIAGPIIDIRVDIDIGQKHIFVTVGIGQNRNYLQECHCQEKPYESVFVFHEFKYPGVAARVVDFVGIGQPKAADEVEQVQTAIKCMECSSVYILEVAPVPGEVVVSVGQGVHDQLHRHAQDHQDAEHRGTLFHGIVVFEDEPL